MTDKEAIEKIEGLKRYLLVHGWQDLTELDRAIKAFEFVDKVKKALSRNDFPEYFQDDVYEIIKEYDKETNNDSQKSD